MLSIRPQSSDDLVSLPSIQSPEYLRRQTRWIRDELDVVVARDGPNALHSDDVLNLDEFLRLLLTSDLSLDSIRYSRIHLAVLDIIGRATRWPKRLIERCEVLQESWNDRYGALKDIGVILDEPGGRLFGIPLPDGSNWDSPVSRWKITPGLNSNPSKAKKFGDLGFLPGQWWINADFAFLDGMIDSPKRGAITFDAKGAYAVVMTGDDEVESKDAETFVYRAQASCRGRYRLTSGTPESRQPIRILRSHALRSVWAPRAGLRYDGLHRVAGWSIGSVSAAKKVIEYSIVFERLPSEAAMTSVLLRPWVDEIEDYQKYKHQERNVRRKAAEAKFVKRNPKSPTGELVRRDGDVDKDHPQ